MPRCRAAITRLPSSEGAAAARGPLGRFDTDVSFDAKVTGGITLSKAGARKYQILILYNLCKGLGQSF
jgi:hypothetical protein